MYLAPQDPGGAHPAREMLARAGHQTQALADAVGVSQPTVSRWLLAQVTPSDAFVEYVCGLLHRPAPDLFNHIMTSDAFGRPVMKILNTGTARPRASRPVCRCVCTCGAVERAA